MVRELASRNFVQEVINSSSTVVVDFWAPWCGPCKMLGPVIKEVSKELSGKAEFFKLNVDDNNDIAQQYRVTSIPTVIVFKNGRVADTMIGFRPKGDIIKFISKHI
ncbi:thioredoxin [Clostridium sediminicola]|uniref:thioredoxin n=1 Tax=Clostridium sediminicola TaxID=3114879 RepID=UPI0031F237F1